MIILGFKTEYRQNRNPVDWVHLAGDGESLDKTKTWQRIKDVMPAKIDSDPEPGSSVYEATLKWGKIKEAYEAWKKGEEIPAEGTPLSAWSGVNADQAAHFKRLGVVTVEGVRDASDGIFSALPFPNARALKELAARFLDGASSAAKDAENAELRERLAALEAALEGAPQVEARRPGRPRKEAA